MNECHKCACNQAALDDFHYVIALRLFNLVHYSSNATCEEPMVQILAGEYKVAKTPEGKQKHSLIISNNSTLIMTKRSRIMTQLKSISRLIERYLDFIG